MSNSVTKEDVKVLEEGILASNEKVNDVVRLIEICEQAAKGSAEAADDEVVHAAAHSAMRVFRHLSSGLAARARKRAKLAGAAPKKDKDGADKLQAHATFLRSKFTWYIDSLVGLLAHDEPSLRMAALRILMDFVRREGEEGRALFTHPERLDAPPKFSAATFAKVLAALVRVPEACGDIVEFFTTEFLNYDDVRYYVLRNFSLMFEKAPEDGAFPHHVVRHLFALLAGVAMPTSAAEIDDFYVPLPPADAQGGGDQQKKKGKRKRAEMEAEGGEEDGGDKPPALKVQDLKLQRKLFTDSWKGFLALPLPPEIYKKVLIRLHVDILPHLTQPRMLMDFLTDSYNIGGVVSLLALNGLFILISKHNLEYPAFYPKLYALLQPSVFHVKYRARFFRLAALFLRSRMLPSNLVAAFIKRLARLALTAPPAGCLTIIPLIYNLMVAHPVTVSLIHAPGATKSPFAMPTEASAAADDVYDANEADPAKANAATSSLWEIQVLQHHYCPAVSKMAKIFENPLSKKVKYNMDDFVDASYDSLVTAEIKRRTKQVPLAYEGATSLFSADDFPPEEWVLPTAVATTAEGAGN